MTMWHDMAADEFDFWLEIRELYTDWKLKFSASFHDDPPEYLDLLVDKVKFPIDILAIPRNTSYLEWAENSFNLTGEDERLLFAFAQAIYPPRKPNEAMISKLIPAGDRFKAFHLKRRKLASLLDDIGYLAKNEMIYPDSSYQYWNKHALLSY